MPVAGAYLISPDGETKKMFTDRTIPRMLSEGWTVASGQTVGTVSRSAPEQRITGESYEAQARYGDARRMVPSEQLHEEAVQAERARKYEGRTGEALLTGAARGLSMGLSDPLLTGLGIVSPERLEGVQEHNTTASTVGELGSMLAGGMGALGKGAAGAALRKTPVGALSAKAAQVGERGTAAYIAANAAEAGVYGVGQNLSHIAIHDEELTAEHLVVDSLSSGLKAGVFGGVGAAAFKGAGKLYGAAKGLRKAKAAPEFDLTTAEGAKFMGETARHLEESVKFGDDLIYKTDSKTIRKALEDEIGLAQWEQYSKAHMDDVMSRSKAYRNSIAKQEFVEPVLPAKVPDVEGHAKRLESLEDELGRASKGPLGLGEAGPAGRAGRVSNLEEHMAAKAEGSLPFSAPRHPDEIAAELKALRKAGPEMGDDAAAMAKYEDDLDDWTTKVSEQKLITDGVDEATQAIARQKSFMGEARKLGKEFDPDDYTSEYVTNLKRILGDDADEIKKFTEHSEEHMRNMNYAKRRLEEGVPEGTKAARTAYTDSVKGLKSSLGGDMSMQSIAKVLNGDANEIVGFVNAAGTHLRAAKELALASGDKAALQRAEDTIKAIQKNISEGIPPAVSDMSGSTVADLAAGAGMLDVALLGLGNQDGMLDELAKGAVIYSLLKRGKIGKGMVGDATQAASKGAAGKLAQDAAAAGGGGALRSMVKGGGMAKGALRSGLGMIGYKGARGALNAADLYRAQGAATSAVSQAVQRMIKGTVKASMGGAGSAAMLKALKLSEEGKRERRDREESLQSLFKHKSDQLLRYAADPQKLAQLMYEQTAELRAAHPTLGDKAEVALGEDLKYLVERMPKDPGSSHMLGISTWEPDDFDIHKFGQVIQGIVNPMSVVDGVTNNTVSMLAAKAFRDRRPAMFAKLGAEVARRAPELQKKLDYDQLNNLAILMGQPLSSVTEPDYIKFVVSSYTTAKEEESASMKDIDANALINGTPTQAQQLLARGTK